MDSLLQPIRTEPHMDDDALTPPPSPEINNTTDKFKDLTKYPSFQCLAILDKTDVIGKINSMLARGKAEKWLIDIKELTIGTKIGEGSNSYVNTCQWRGIDIVVKRPKYKKLSQLLDLLNEIQLWSQLRHPYLVQFLGASYDAEENDFYIMMEKIDGDHLGEFISAKTRSKTMSSSLSRYSRYQICSQLINVIKFLHSCNPPIIYRDLKPENIMIDRFNNVKLTDLGLSRHMPETSTYKLTGGTGTIRYMAPEVYLGKHYNLKADVYSLGFILYYIFTGVKPFNQYNTGTIRTYMENTDLVHSLDNVKHTEWRNIITHCIKKDVEQRWDINRLGDEVNKLTVGDTPKCALS
jgi:serine/threonine protein kinase